MIFCAWGFGIVLLAAGLLILFGSLDSAQGIDQATFSGPVY
ncbi:MAG: hypothetical protein AAFX06_21980 [Planctomycetota bacterium]